MSENDLNEIEERLGELDTRQLLVFIEKMLGSEILTDAQRQEVHEAKHLLSMQERESKQRLGGFLRERGPEMLKLLLEAQKDLTLTDEERAKLNRTVEMLAGSLMSYWLPPTLGRRVLMFVFLAVGVLGAILWTPWLGLFVILGAMFSPRMMGEVLVLVATLRG